MRREIERLRKRLDILIYCKPRHDRVCGKPGLSLTSGGSIRAARKKMTLQLLFKILARPLQGLSFSLECECGLGAKARSRVKNLSKSHLISGCLRKKFPNSNPDANSAPKPLNSRNFPLFPGICRFLFHLSNIGDSPNIFQQNQYRQMRGIEDGNGGGLSAFPFALQPFLSRPFVLELHPPGRLRLRICRICPPAKP